MKNILFICHGNICRSPMAEYVMKDLVKKAARAYQFHGASWRSMGSPATAMWRGSSPIRTTTSTTC